MYIRKIVKMKEPNICNKACIAFKDFDGMHL